MWLRRSISSILFFLLIGFGVFIAFNYHSSKKDVFTNIVSSKQDSTRNSTHLISEFFDTKIKFIENLAKEVETSGDVSYEKISTLIQELYNYTDVAVLFAGWESDGSMFAVDVAHKNGYLLTPKKDNYDARSRSWFKSVKENKRTVLFDVYQEVGGGGHMAIAISVPVYINGNLALIVAAEIYLDELQVQIAKSQASSSKSASFFILDGQHNIISHSHPELVMSQDKELMRIVNLSLDAVNAIDKQSQGTHQPTDLIHYEMYGDKRVSVCMRNELDWVVCTSNSQSDYNETLNDLLFSQIVFSLIFVIVILAILYVVVSHSLKPLGVIQKGLSQFFDFLNHKSDALSPIAIHSRDEFGAMANVINQNIDRTKENLAQDSKLVQEIDEIVQEAKQGRFGKIATQKSSNPQTNKLKDSLNEMSGALHQLVGDNLADAAEVFNAYERNDFTPRVQDPMGLEQSINTLGDSISAMLKTSADFANDLSVQSQEIKDTMQKLLSGSHTQAASLEQSAAALEQINVAMQNTSEKTSETSRQAEDIKHITNVIKDIADQTNLLALNAAIEAARAGEHGREFAVVADEVRKLAEKTTKSLSEVEANVNLLVQSASDMSETIKEQTDGLCQINEAIAQLETLTQENVEIANHTNEITKRVESSANAILGDTKSKKF